MDLNEHQEESTYFNLKTEDLATIKIVENGSKDGCYISNPQNP